jgi:hypothetical protein
LTTVVSFGLLRPCTRKSVPSNPMQTLKSLLLALAFLVGASIVIGALGYCFAQLIVGGVN